MALFYTKARGGIDVIDELFKNRAAVFSVIFAYEVK